MVRTLVLCSNYSAIFILFILILKVFANQDEYLYDTDEYKSDIAPHIELLVSSTHNLHKREIPPEIHQHENNVSVKFPTVLPTTTAPKTESKSKTDVAKKPILPEKLNVTLPKGVGKNLGENGTGIRMNNTSTTVAPLPFSTNDDHLVIPKVQKNDTSNESTSEDSSEISIDKFSEDTQSTLFNETLQKHNINESKTDSHTYYNSTFTVDANVTERYWVNMDNNSDVRVNELLSNAHRRAATVKLSFDFPFYGHFVRNVTIATGGFVYMGEYVHSWLAATQYIAPLMANFDTGLANHSLIKYLDNGTAFTVTWEQVLLQDSQSDGPFTFQATLYNNGDVVFVYKHIPVLVESILDVQHPVKVGISDAYIIDHAIFYVRRKTIYEYHQVQFNKSDIKNNTVIYLTALPTCLDSKDCNTCLTNQIDNFNCSWCPSTNRCSNGLDRHRQDWFAKGCDRMTITNVTRCSQLNVFDGINQNDEHNTYYDTDKHDDKTQPTNPFQNNTSRIPNNQNSNKVKPIDSSQENNSISNSVQASRISQNTERMDSNGDVKMGASGIITILFIVAIVATLAVWVLYAYRNPHTTSGQILIRYRPSQWRWRRGEARYTAATIHM